MAGHRFLSVDDLLNDLDHGGEVEFIYKGLHYAITHTQLGIHVMQTSDCSTEKIYSSPSDVANYSIDGEDLGYILDELDITFRNYPH